MDLFRKLKETVDPINKMTPGQIVHSMPGVWVRVPICICAGYYESKSTEVNIIDIDAMSHAIAETDVHIYGRNPTRVMYGEPFQYAINILSHSPLKGSDIESIEDATHALLTAELVKGGTNISETLAIQAANLGFFNISKPLIKDFLSEGFPPDDQKINEIVEKYTAIVFTFAD
jgi:hypothetical protein